MKTRNELINGLVELGSRLRVDDMKFLAEVAEALKAIPDEEEKRPRRTKRVRRGGRK